MALDGLSRHVNVAHPTGRGKLVGLLVVSEVSGAVAGERESRGVRCMSGDVGKLEAKAEPFGEAESAAG